MVDLRLRGRAAVVGLVLAAAWPATAGAAEPPCAREQDACLDVELTVRRAGDRVPQADTRVTVVEPGPRPTWTVVERTDEHGRVVLRLPGGPFRVVVLAAGFERYDERFEASSSGGSDGAPRSVRVVLEPSSSNPYRTTVASQRDVQPGVSPRRLDREEMATAPGTQGDPLRALQSLPGVARTPGGLGLLVLRGASPTQSVTFVGEHRVPRAFHALAISSVIPADALSEVEYVPGNFSSRYGNGTGGAVILRPRAGRRDGVHGFGEIDLTASGGLVEGRLGPGSFLAAAQRSYIDALLRTVERVDPNQSFVLPSAWDYQLFIDEPLAPRTTLTTRILGAEDRIASRPGHPGRISSGLELRSGFHRADLELRHRSGPVRMLLSPSFRVEHQSLGVDEVRSRRRDHVFSGRAELTARLSPRADLTVGADVEVDPFVAVTHTYSERIPVEQTYRALWTSTGLYATTDLRWGRLRLSPGVRLNAFTLERRAKLGVDPRLLSLLELSPRWSWTAGVGLYSQAQLDVGQASGFSFVSETLGFTSINRWNFPSALQELTPTIVLTPTSPHVRLAQALQASTAVTFSPNDAWALEVGGYARVRDESLSLAPDYAGEVRPSFPPVTRNYGVELLLRRRNVGRLYGWLSYTLSWAERELGLPNDRTKIVIDPFDQRHNLALVVSLALPRHWRIGGRMRVVSGSPYTPVLGAIDRPTEIVTPGITAIPLYGDESSGRFPLFHQLDLRADRRWYLDRAIINAYVDVQNVYNRQNVEAYLYSADFRRQDWSLGLPVLPSIGIRVEY